MTQLQQFIAVLNLNLKINAFFFKCKKTKFILRIVKLLVKNNYFVGYKTCMRDSSKLIIFFKLNFEKNRPFMLSCEQISKSNRPIYLKFNQWSQSSSSLLILSTTRGILTNKEAWNYRLGGIVLCKIT
jgi:ribosomal protein S8